MSLHKPPLVISYVCKIIFLRLWRVFAIIFFIIGPLGQTNLKSCFTSTAGQILATFIYKYKDDVIACSRDTCELLKWLLTTAPIRTFGKAWKSIFHNDFFRFVDNLHARLFGFLIMIFISIYNDIHWICLQIYSCHPGHFQGEVYS